MPPEHPFPAALDDAMTVWKAAQKRRAAKNMAVFGSSAGGGLTLSMVLQAQDGQSAAAGRDRDGHADVRSHGGGGRYVPHQRTGRQRADRARGESATRAPKIYANGHDFKDPLLSPVYGEMTGFPPTMLISGTRDLLLSNTVRVHRKLRQAGVKADLHVFEGQAHGGW